MIDIGYYKCKFRTRHNWENWSKQTKEEPVDDGVVYGHCLQDGTPWEVRTFDYTSRRGKPMHGYSYKLPPPGSEILHTAHQPHDPDTRGIGPTKEVALDGLRRALHHKAKVQMRVVQLRKENDEALGAFCDAVGEALDRVDTMAEMAEKLETAANTCTEVAMRRLEESGGKWRSS